MERARSSASGARAASPPPTRAAPARPPAAAILALQRTAGNAAVTRMLRGPVLQRMVGFELEFDVMLSKAAPQEGAAALGAPENVGTRTDFENDRYGKVEYLRRQTKRNVEVVEWIEGSKGVGGARDVFALRWQDDSLDNSQRAIRPKTLAADEPGRWVIATKEPQKLMVDPLLDKEDKLFAATAGEPYDVVEDHFNGEMLPGVAINSIVEVVTQARDEFGPEAAFAEPLVRAAHLMERIAAETKDFTERIPATRIFPGTRRDLHLAGGVPSALGSDRGLQGKTAWIQATLGVSLGGVSQLFEERSKDSTKLNKLNEDDILYAAQTAVGKTLSRLPFKPRDERAVEGFLQLLAMYLSGGHPRYQYKESLDKNLVPYIVRHGMFAARIAGLSPEDEAGLRDHADGIGAMLLEAVGRDAGEPLFTQRPSGPRAGAWVQQGLAGKADDQVERWGLMKEIQPEPVGPPDGPRPSGAILEERSVGRKPSSEWLAMALRYREMAQRLNQTRAPAVKT